MNSLWNQPTFIGVSCFRTDWLHTADLGIAADFLGQLFWKCLRKLQGRNIKEKVNTLWGLMQHFYQTNKSTDRLQGLSPGMLKAAGKHPKLRSQAAVCRCLVPFGKQLAEQFLDGEGAEESTARHCANLLHQCYQCLRSGDSVLLKSSSTRFALLFCDLQKLDAKAWRVKPKLHMWLELCAEPGGLPTTCWTYRDEDFGGGAAGLSRRRGGGLTPQGFSRNLVNRFAMFPMVRIL